VEGDAHGPLTLLLKADLRAIDKSFEGTLEWIRRCQESDWEPTFDFSVTTSDKSNVELRPGGNNHIVSYNERLEWIELALKARLEEGDLQVRMTVVAPCSLLVSYLNASRVCRASTS
jgi:hypothetical protein